MTNLVLVLSMPPAQDLLHVFEKVDRNGDKVVNRMVGMVQLGESKLAQEIRLACKFMCKQFEIDTKRVTGNYPLLCPRSITGAGAVQVHARERRRQQRHPRL